MRLETDLWVGKFSALKALIFAKSLAGHKLSAIETKCLEHFVIRRTWGMWWWDFNKEEPLQEDLVVYQKFAEMRSERKKMDQDKAQQKADAAAARDSGKVKGSTYSFGDPSTK